MTHRDLFLRPSCCQFVQFISRSFGGDEFNVCVSPAPPVLFCYPALITTPTADPAVICTSPTKAAAVRGLDGQCFMNSGKANLSPYIAVKLCQTRLPPSLLSYCPLLRSSVPILYKVGGVVWCGAARSIALNAIQVMTLLWLRSQRQQNTASALSEPFRTKHSSV